MVDETDGELQRVRLMLQHWCSTAMSVNRQRYHIALPLEPVPRLEVGQAARIDVAPTERVLTDVALDELDKARADQR